MFSPHVLIEYSPWYLQQQKGPSCNSFYYILLSHTVVCVCNPCKISMGLKGINSYSARELSAIVKQARGGRFIKADTSCTGDTFTFYFSCPMCKMAVILLLCLVQCWFEWSWEEMSCILPQAGIDRARAWTKQFVYNLRITLVFLKGYAMPK